MSCDHTQRSDDPHATFSIPTTGLNHNVCTPQSGAHPEAHPNIIVGTKRMILIKIRLIETQYTVLLISLLIK